MKKIYWVLIIVVILIVLGTVVIIVYKKKAAYILINNRKIPVELALTESQRQKGLSSRDHLDADTGMLFIFPDSNIHSFWMKDTLIPLDVIWINDGKIVEMTTLDMQTEENIPQYTPQNKAQYVLELNAGAINENNFQVGDKVEIKY